MKTIEEKMSDYFGVAYKTLGISGNMDSLPDDKKLQTLSLIIEVAKMAQLEELLPAPTPTKND